MNRGKLAKEIHENNVEKGFWDKERNLKEIYILIITELSEAIEAHREGRHAAMSQFQDELDRQKKWDNVKNDFVTPFRQCIKDTVEDELADAWIRCADWLYFKNREHILLPKFEHVFEDNFASGVFDIAKEITSMNSEGAMYLIEKFCKKHDIDLLSHIELKIKYNKTRKKMHGKKY